MSAQTAYTPENPCIGAKCLICGTLVTTDLARIRHMLEKGFGLVRCRAESSRHEVSSVDDMKGMQGPGARQEVTVS